MHHRKNITDTKFLNLTATTTAPNQTITLTRLTVSKPSTIFWGDGTVETLPANSTSAVVHSYATPGTYKITVAKAKNITQLQLESSTIGGLNTAELRKSVITYFYITAITNSNINSADMVNWRPDYFYLFTMPAGKYSISSSDMVNWRPFGWCFHSMPAGTYSISSADMVNWRPDYFYLYSIPAGTYSISSSDMVNWRPLYWILYSMPAGTYSISSADMVNWRPLYWNLHSMPAGTSTFVESCMRNWNGINSIGCNDLSLDQATVDRILFDIYAGRMGYTYATPALNVGGNNADPSGVYQAMVPPTTGLEAKYDLVNDPASEGFKKWSITT